MVVEKRMNMGAMGTSQCSDNEGYTAGWDWDEIRWGQAPEPDFESGTTCLTRFGSSHPEGVNFVLCDGSVRYVLYGIDPTVFLNACRPNDNQATTLP